MEPITHLEQGVTQEPPDLPVYEPPKVLTYRGDQILDLLGPAQACSFSHSVVICGDSPEQWLPPGS